MRSPARFVTQPVGLPVGLNYQFENPRTIVRTATYSWIQSNLQHLTEVQLPPGKNIFSLELAPRGPLRLKDYGFVQSLSLELYQQDVMYGRPGEVPAYHWPLPTRIVTRPWLFVQQSAIRAVAGPVRDIAYTVGIPDDRWAVGQLQGRWTIGPPTPG